MMIAGRNIKKRYLIGGLFVLFLLVKCTGHSAPQVAYVPQPTAAPVQYDDTPMQQQPAAPVTIVNAPAQHSDGGFWNGFMAGHFFSNHGSSYDRGVSSRRTTIVKNTTVNNFVRQSRRPGLTTSYTSRPPASFKTSTWKSNSRMGWGSRSRSSRSRRR